MVDNQQQRYYRSIAERIDEPTLTRRHSNNGCVSRPIRLLLTVSWLIVFLFTQFSYASGGGENDAKTLRQHAVSDRSANVPNHRERPDSNTPENLRRLRRFKRQYYEDGYYGNYYWQTGRIIGWFLGLVIFLMIICVPCICCIGIWFAGWFGFRQAMMARNTNRPPGRGGGGAVSYTLGPSASPPPPPPGGAEVMEQHDTRVVRQQQYVDAADPPPQHLPRNVNVIYEDRYNNHDRYRSSSRHVSSPPPIQPYHHGQRHRRDSAEESREYYRETRRL